MEDFLQFGKYTVGHLLCNCCNKITGTDKNIVNVFVAGKQVVPFEVEKTLEGEQTA